MLYINPVLRCKPNMLVPFSKNKLKASFCCPQHKRQLRERWQQVADIVARFTKRHDVQVAAQALHWMSCFLYVVLYIWGTYQHAQPGSWRAALDMVLGVVFAVEFTHRILVSLKEIVNAF